MYLIQIKVIQEQLEEMLSSELTNFTFDISNHIRQNVLVYYWVRGARLKLMCQHKCSTFGAGNASHLLFTTAGISVASNPIPVSGEG